MNDQPACRLSVAMDAAIADPYVAARRVQPENSLNNRRLARPVDAPQCDRLAAAHFQVQIIDGDISAEFFV